MEDKFYWSNFAKDAKTRPIASYFNETKNKAFIPSGGIWLQSVDDDTISLLAGTFDLLNYENGDEEETKYSYETADLMATCYLIAGWENTEYCKSIPIDKFNHFLAVFKIAVYSEEMRRDGLVFINGNGKITEDSTVIKNTNALVAAKNEAKAKAKDIQHPQIDLTELN